MGHSTRRTAGQPAPAPFFRPPEGDVDCGDHKFLSIGVPAITSPNRIPSHSCACLLSVGLALAGCGGAPEGEEEGAAPPVSESREAAETTAPRPEISGAAFRDAAFNGNLVTVARGIKQGVEVDAAGEQGRTALMLAAYNGHVQVVQYLLDSGAAVDLRDATDRTALMYAATGPDVETVRTLLDAGADVNATDNEERWTPLMFAAAEGHAQVVQTLLDRGADTGAEDADRETALDFAVNNGHREAVELLRKQ